MTIAVADIGTGSQLYSPHWMKQSEIKQYFHWQYLIYGYWNAENGGGGLCGALRWLFVMYHPLSPRMYQELNYTHRHLWSKDKN